jgi:2-keto-4-pentenoate hydratase
MPGLPESVRPRTLAEGLAAQEALEAFAGPVGGWKLAATSQAGQRHISVSEPLAGRLFERFIFDESATLPPGTLHMAVVEAEFAFRLGMDLPDGETYSHEQIVEAIDTLHPAIEVPESRFDDFTEVGAAQLAADDACAGRFVLGEAVDGWHRRDLAAHEVRIRIDSREVARGCGANVLSHPVEALRWLANADKGGAPLLAGQVVTTGTTTVPPAIRAGNEVEADFGALGTVSVRFAPGDPPE